MVKSLWERIIDPDRVFIIAEAGVNHNGNIETALQLVDVALRSGVNAVKFQTFSAERLVIPETKKADYQFRDTGNSESQLEMLKQLELSYSDYQRLYDYCTDKGIIFLSTPFDKKSADFLEELGVKVFKISSGEITNIPLLFHIGRKKKPVILSTGMSTIEEIKVALKTIYDAGTKDVILLHCVSNYPARLKDVNLRAMQTMAKVFSVPVGYSDHTLGIDISIAAVALGASVIEKHFTLNHNLAGPDHKSSIEPDQLKELVESIRRVEISLGNGCKKPSKSEQDVADSVRKSLIAACKIKAGTVLKEELIAIKRPGTGLPPQMMSSIINRKAKSDIPENELLSLDMFI